MSAEAAVVTATAARSVWPVWSDPRRWTWWGRALGVYLATRAFSAVVFVVVARRQVENYWTPAKPSYLRFTGLMWDASWYRTIAEQGYPDVLPRGADGLVQQNPWAFFPLFPYVVRWFMMVTRSPWYVAAPLVAMALGAVAALVVYRLIERGAPRAVEARPGLPLATVALLGVFPTAAILQTGSTESLAVLLVAASLLLIVERRYVGASVAILALGFTRAVALPMAAVIVVHGLLRWRGSRSGDDRLARVDVAGLGLLGGTAVVSGVAWPLICGWVTGVPDGYLKTQGAWRGVRAIKPFASWGYTSSFWTKEWWPYPYVLVLGVGVVVACLVVPAARRLGNELHVWSAAYLFYIAAVIEPGSSIARFAILAFPLGAVTAGLVTRPPSRRRLWFGFVVVLMAVLQVTWIYNTWRMTPPVGWPP